MLGELDSFFLANNFFLYLMNSKEICPNTIFDLQSFFYKKKKIRDLDETEEMECLLYRFEFALNKCKSLLYPRGIYCSRFKVIFFIFT